MVLLGKKMVKTNPFQENVVFLQSVNCQLNNKSYEETISITRGRLDDSRVCYI